MIKRISLSDILFGLVAAAFLGALLAFAYLGHFTRYMADDYCLAAAVHTSGFIKAQVALYMSWTGRYSYNFLMSLAELIGPATVPIGPSLGITCWLVAAVWSLYQIALIAQWPRPVVTSWVIAELIIFAMLNSANNIAQSFYWQGGLVNYAAPLILLTTYVGIVSYGIRRTVQKRTALLLVILSAVVTFLAGGFTEAFVFLQTTGLLLAVIACYMSSDLLKRAARPFIIAGLAGSLIALFVVVLAPGNSARRSFFPPPPNLFTLTKFSLYYVLHFVAYTVYYSPLTTLLLVLLPTVLGSYLHNAGSGNKQEFDVKKIRMLFFYLPIVAFFLVLSCFVPGVYATSNDLPGRAHMIPQFILVCATIYWGYLAGTALSAHSSIFRRKGWPLTACSIAVAILVLSVPLVAIQRTLSLVPRARESASIWDQMDQEIRAAKAQGRLNLTVPVVDDIETRLGATHTELNLEHDPQNWKNRCAAVYYGVNSIQAR